MLTDYSEYKLLRLLNQRSIHISVKIKYISQEYGYYMTKTGKKQKKYGIITKIKCL